jgi:OOP family OmpA-OmpF porin
MKKLIFAMIAGAGAVGAAQAAAPGPYVGVGVATADHQYNLSGATGTSSDGYKASGKVFAGYDFDQTWGVEAGYTDFRKSNANYTLNGASGTAQSSGHAFYVAGKATAPINEQFAVFGKLGATNNHSSLSSATPAYNSSYSKTELYGGVGLQYNINQKVALTAEYERYSKKHDFGAKPDVFTIGAKYAF